MSLFAIIIAVYGIIHSLITRDFTWFQRSGSLLVAIGIILLSRTSIIGKDFLLYVKSSDTPYNVNSAQHYNAINEPIPEHVATDVKSRNAVGWIGPLISSLGTIILGYGDLLNFIFK